MQYLRGERSFLPRGGLLQSRPHSLDRVMSRVLILGGTRNLGHITAMHLLHAGHSVSVLNRGVTTAELPAEAERLKASRGNKPALISALGARDFDVVLDTTTYTEADAHEAVEIFRGRAGRYVFISSGQVYLVRDRARRPFGEEDYEGTVLPAPSERTRDYAEWKYGVDKRNAEAVFSSANRDEAFPVTTLRLPMVASERDHYGRLQGYFARLLDGEPILVPGEAGLPLRHVYAADVARLIVGLCTSNAGIGEALNISSGESMSLSSYLELLSRISATSLRIVRLPRAELERQELLPACSPFSGTWMSELDNSRGLRSLGAVLEYTPPEDYLPLILDDYKERWLNGGLSPGGYAQRENELSALKAI